MVGDQAVRIKSAVELAFALNEIIQIETVVIFLGKNRLAIVSSMDHMMGVIGYDELTDTGHKASMKSQSSLAINKSVPVFTQGFLDKGIYKFQQRPLGLFLDIQTTLLSIFQVILLVPALESARRKRLGNLLFGRVLRPAKRRTGHYQNQEVSR